MFSFLLFTISNKEIFQAILEYAKQFNSFYFSLNMKIIPHFPKLFYFFLGPSQFGKYLQKALLDNGLAATEVPT